MTDDKIAKAVERLGVESCLHAHHALAAVFVAAAEEDRLYLEMKRKERDDDVPDAEFQRMWVEWRRAQARKREALNRAAEKVLA